MQRIAFSLGLLYIVSLLAGPVFAGDDDQPRNIRISINPFSGAPGTIISVSGNGADSTQIVIITLASQPDSADGALATTTVTPSERGTFEATLTVPADIVDGRYYVLGEQFAPNGNVMQYYYNEFIVGSLSGDALLPVTGTVPGTPFTVTASLAILLVVVMTARGIYAIRVGY